MNHQLWRLDAAATTESLTTDLRAYLAHATLTTILVRIGDRTRAYLALDGCAGCVIGRCLPGCRTDLLRRALTAQGGGTLTLVRDGLARRTYTRAVLACPLRDAQPLDAALLAAWPEARLTLAWRGGQGSRVMVGALLLTGAAGDAPTAALGARRWRAIALPTHVLLRRYHLPIPPAPPLSVTWPGEPYLLTAGSDLTRTPGPTSATLTDAPDAADDMLAEWLHLVCADPERVLREAQAVHAASPTSSAMAHPSDDRWPAGPAGMPASVLAELVPQLLVEPSFQSTRNGQSGITKGRLVGLRHNTISDATARALMVWFDRAGLLAPPENGQGPWRGPRRFALTDLDAIATKLRATPLPRADEIRTAYGGE